MPRGRTTDWPRPVRHGEQGPGLSSRRPRCPRLRYLSGASGMMETAMSGSEQGAGSGQPGREAGLRARLGVPAGAKRVIIFAESSHWDPNWRLTSGDYFRRLVGPNLDKAVAELLREPRRVYSIECVFFLRLYWEARPERQGTVRALVNEGRLRLTSSGVTTADTILPGAEAILRDLLLGQEWLRSRGMTQEPALAYFPDSFGASPALPSLLRAAGFGQAALTHIDGALHPSSFHEAAFRRFPRPGSSAARLEKEERCLDFVWRGPDGAEVLCHWNRHGYNQGDTLAYRGLGRGGLNNFALPDRSDRNVAGKVRRFAGQLLPYARTPYLFCAIGGDFIDPIAGLAALLDRYNRRHYPSTGIWAVNAGLDDYLSLVDCYRPALPVLEMDPNPCWTGFYASRPSLKRKCRELIGGLQLAEHLSLLPENEGRAGPVAEALAEGWWHAAASNHHDFITGTASDAVVRGEQEPWLDRGMAEARAAREGLASPRGREAGPAPPPRWQRRQGVLEIASPHYVVELDEGRGGCIARARHPVTGAPLLSLSDCVVSYRDSGGLWRMGHEYLGGWLREAGRSCDRPARLEVSEAGDGCLEVSGTVEVDGQAVRRACRFASGCPAMGFSVEGRAGPRRTVTVRFGTGLAPDRLAMDTPGGVVFRPLDRVYSPTFWPVQSFVHVQDRATGRGVALCLSLPGAVACRPDGTLELVVLRNATGERVLGLFPLQGMTVSGTEASRHECRYALLFTEAGDWRDNSIPLAARRAFGGPEDRAVWEDPAVSLAWADRPEVTVMAVKPASRGEGAIVRLGNWGETGLPVNVTVRGRPLKAAFLCDARERDLGPLPVSGRTVRLAMPGALASIRVVR